MAKFLFTLSAAFFLFFAVNKANSTDTRNILVQKQNPPSLTVTPLTAASALMSWTPFGSPGPYTVKVTDLTTGKVLTEISTYQTSRIITGLTEGHAYRFSTAKYHDKIIVEVETGG